MLSASVLLGRKYKRGQYLDPNAWVGHDTVARRAGNNARCACGDRGRTGQGWRSGANARCEAYEKGSSNYETAHRDSLQVGRSLQEQFKPARTKLHTNFANSL